MPERLQKLIARAGVTSRRKAEELITEGRVTVNDEVVRELGAKADLVTDSVRVDGKTLHSNETRRYLVLNKPKGCITTTDDPEGRPTVMDLLGPEASKGLFPVGRLDYNTEGLLILTDDGDFANHILSAKNKVPKTYEVKVSGQPPEEAIQKLRDGIKLDGRIARPESITMVRRADKPWYQITLVQGRNRQIHRMFERIGVLVEKIRRVRIGGLTLRGLEPRQIRELRRAEVQQLLSPNQDYAYRAEEGRRSQTGRERPRPHPARHRADRSQSRRPAAGPRRRAGPAQGRPAKSGSRRPARNGDRRPARSEDRRPARSEDRRPARGGDRRPARSEDRRPARSEDRRPARGEDRRPDRHSESPRDSARADRLRQSGKPQRSPGRRRPTGEGSPARAKASGRGGSPRRSQAPSREPRSSRPGSKAKP